MLPSKFPSSMPDNHFSLLGVLLGDSGQLFDSPFLDVEDRRSLRLICREARDLTLNLITEARVIVDAPSLALVGLEGTEGAQRLASFHSKLRCLTKLRLEARGLKPGAGDAAALTFQFFEAQRAAQGWLELYLQHAWIAGALTVSMVGGMRRFRAAQAIWQFRSRTRRCCGHLHEQHLPLAAGLEGTCGAGCRPTCHAMP